MQWAMGNVQWAMCSGQCAVGHGYWVGTASNGQKVNCCPIRSHCAVRFVNCAMCFAIQNEQRGLCGLQQLSGIQTKDGGSFYSFYIFCTSINIYRI